MSFDPGIIILIWSRLELGEVFMADDHIKTTSGIESWFRSFIPAHIFDRTVIGAYRFLDALNHYSKRRADSDFLQNKFEWGKCRDRACGPHGFIEWQSVLTDMKYGSVTVAYAGCEVIAVYNTLLDLANGLIIDDINFMPHIKVNSYESNISSDIDVPVLEGRSSLSGLSGFSNHPDFPELLRSFELNGMVLGGRFGTSPYSLLNFFKAAGFEAAFTTDRSEYAEFERTYKTFILTMYNDVRDITKEIHTVSMSVDSNGQLVAHNTGIAGFADRSYPSFDELLRSYSEYARPIALIGIKA